tara:strand:- start:66374 stop:66628 length:255 start_codon:yes stop_codon:yes gene_type:complete
MGEGADPKEGQPFLKRSAHLPQEIKAIDWKAQTRLCKRFRHLSNTGKPQPRELAGFIWNIARKTPSPAPSQATSLTNPCQRDSL